eukprot:1067991-Prymnesium_polylepis.2
MDASAFRVEHVAGYGRIMRAVRTFEPGESVLREQPSMSWEHDRVDELVSSFLCAAPEVQSAVLDMAAPQLDAGLDFMDSEPGRKKAVEARAARAAERSQLAENLAKGYDGPRVLELFKHLVLIADCNAHAFEGRSGLFPVAAKADHSCEPNCGHSTRVGGEMHFFATSKIHPGDEITISYLDHLWSTSRADRRRQMLVEKLFFCRCRRCIRMDGSTPLEEKEERPRGAEQTEPQQLARLECAAAGCSTECATD